MRAAAVFFCRFWQRGRVAGRLDERSRCPRWRAFRTAGKTTTRTTTRRPLGALGRASRGGAASLCCSSLTLQPKPRVAARPNPAELGRLLEHQNREPALGQRARRLQPRDPGPDHDDAHRHLAPYAVRIRSWLYFIWRTRGRGRGGKRGKKELGGVLLQLPSWCLKGGPSGSCALSPPGVKGDAGVDERS